MVAHALSEASELIGVPPARQLANVVLKMLCLGNLTLSVAVFPKMTLLFSVVWIGMERSVLNVPLAHI